MADFAFSLAQKVLEKLASSTYEEISLAWGLEEEIEKFQETMSTIKAVLLDAEERQTNNGAIKIWLTKLKDVFLNARDLLDEIECEVLRGQVVKAHGSVGRKLCHFFSFKPLVFRFSIGDRIKKIRERIDEIAAEKDKFNLNVRHEEKKTIHGRREKTYSYVRASEVIGREVEKQEIVDLLMQSDDERNVDVISICGIGGMGKTTLAKMVYNDGRVKDHFKLKMWVNVSKDFNLPQLIKEIFDSATGKVNENLTLDILQTELRGTLSGMKFLLILDDVWNKIPHKWFELSDMLMEGSKGSKIVVTTRSNRVDLLVRTVPATFNLTGLSEEDSLSLFLKWAFKEGKDKPHEKLVEIGRDIVKRCKGVPLAVRTLGSLLHLTVDEQDWIDVRESETWKLEQNEDDILPVLWLSYNELPSYLKQCFLSCSLFPKGYKFDISYVIQFWIALGVVPQSHDENKSLEYTGEQYFRELRSRSFFQVDENVLDIVQHGLQNTFIMHDLIHDLSLSVAESECLIVNSQTKDIPKRVSITDGVEDKVLTFLNTLDNVRTIRLAVNHEKEPSRACLVDKCIRRFKYLQILDLSNSFFEMLPRSVGRAKHLRYLDLSSNKKITKLPDSICKLQSLLTLKLEGCYNLEGLPRDMKNLISLRFLSITTEETRIPEDRIACLTSLRTLIISGCGNLVTLPDGLRCLTGLEDLRIINCSKLVLNEADDVEIKRLSLRTLRLAFLPKMVALPGWLQGSADTLRYLHIAGCWELRKLPEWLTKMTSIQKIFISFCQDLESLPKEGMHRLTSLQEITISECRKLEDSLKLIREDWVEKVYFDEEPKRAVLVDKCITRFKHLQILDLSNSSFEMLPSSIGRMSQLKYLDLSGNVKMHKLPDSICKLQSLLTLKLEGCSNLEGLPRDMKNLISLRFLSITTNATCIPEDRIACLTSLRTLIISGCGNLVTLPDGLRYLTGLEDLRIIDCEKLVLNEADDVEIKRLSLQTLRLVNLPKMLALPGWLQGSADTLRYLHIAVCGSLKKLPEWLTKMTSIQKILICFCEILESLPEEGMHRLTSLQEIRIDVCPELEKALKLIREDWVKKVHFDKIEECKKKRIQKLLPDHLRQEMPVVTSLCNIM